jgi:hypothetical protein
MQRRQRWPEPGAHFPSYLDVMRSKTPLRQSLLMAASKGGIFQEVTLFHGFWFGPIPKPPAP